MGQLDHLFNGSIELCTIETITSWSRYMLFTFLFYNIDGQSLVDLQATKRLHTILRYARAYMRTHTPTPMHASIPIPRYARLDHFGQ